MTRISRPPVVLFAIGLIGLGALALVYGTFAEIGQTLPHQFPGRLGLAYVSGILMALCGIGLLLDRATAWSVRILLPYLVVGFLLQVPALVMTPGIEVVWEQAGEVAMITSGAWILFAARSGRGKSGLRIGQVLFGLGLLPIGLSHFAYLDHTVDLVPAWLPFRTGWASLTGVAHIAAGLGILFSVVPRLAALMEAGMLGIFTTVVWIPRLVAKPTAPGLWGEFVVSWIIASSAWLVADSFAKKGP
jgi:uncharacterized membrane protein